MKPSQVMTILCAMRRGQLRNMAAKAGVNRGKNKAETAANLADAVSSGKVRIDFTAHFKIPIVKTEDILGPTEQVVGLTRFSTADVEEAEEELAVDTESEKA